jgi:predicted  nucleic acid-binding Zn-ribbon protein
MSDNQDFNNLKDSFTKAFNESMKTVKGIVDVSSQKVKLRSEIGQNERDINKTYARLGEAYYNARKNGGQMGDVDDLLKLIDAKKKLISLLNEKLAVLDQKEEAE